MSLSTFRWVHLPYCLKRLEDGCYVVLNRHYKPLGFLTNDWVDYEAYPVVMKFKGLTPKVAAKLSYKGSEDLAMIYLYNDGCVPTNSAQHM